MQISLLVLQLYYFRERKGMFDNAKLETLSPKAFWGFLKQTHPKLSEVALKFIELPATTAALERVFSMWKNVHTDVRNRLTAEKSFKLTAIYHAMRTSTKTF